MGRRKKILFKGGAKVRYKAKWTYNQSCIRRGQVKESYEAANRLSFAAGLCSCYAYGIGDDYSFAIYDSREEVVKTYGEDDVPNWAKDVQYPIYVFDSVHNDIEVLENPSPTVIIKHIWGESYGDYDLTIKGME
jgi:hypothetical protein